MLNFTRRAAVLALVAASMPAFAADVSKVVVPYAAGGALDVLARMLSQRLQATTGQTYIVENIVGANGNIGAAAASRAPADGKTVLLTSEAYATVNPILFKDNLGYQPSSLDPLTLVAVQPAVLAVRTASSIRNFQDFMRKAKGDGVSYSSGGIGSTSHLTSGYLNAVAGPLKLTHVPYTGGAPAINAIIGGTVDAGFISSGNVLPHVRGGKLRAIAVSSATRLPQLPDVPTIAELGYPGFDTEAAIIILAPVETPAPVKQQIAANLRKVVATPEIRKYLETNGFVVRNTTPEEAKSWLAAETRKWVDLIEQKNILKD